MWAYPRRCGEHCLRDRKRSRDRGLPPQVRGARSGPGLPGGYDGLTPAGAGSTGDPARPSRYRLAYPRRCGEHIIHSVGGEMGRGLPPQVRGAQDTGGKDHGIVWLTPAGAGSTEAAQRPRADPRAYPRRCGEHRRRRLLRLYGRGLPPQVRGAPARSGRVMAVDGLTPAGAGSTRRTRRRASRAAGLPPQVRGAQRHRQLSGPVDGLTPAGAGSTWQAGVPA